MSPVAIAPAPPAGELVWRWGIQSVSSTGFQYRTLPPSDPGSGLAETQGAPGQSESTISDGVGLRARIELAVGGAGTGARQYALLLAAATQAGESPWWNLLSSPQSGLPDLSWSWTVPVRAEVTAVTDVVAAYALVGLAPSWGTGAGNPGWLPERPNIGWLCMGGNWRAVAYPGGSGGGFVPVFDELTTAPGNSRQLLELRLNRIGGQADIQWFANGLPVARWRPGAPVPLSPAFGLNAGSRLQVGVTRASAAGTDGVILDVLGDQPSVVRSRYAIPQ